MTPNTGYRIPDDRIWAADNGCFSKPETFDPVAYLGWLVQRRHIADRCLFATAPDVVGDAKATMSRAKPFLPILRAIGYKAALVAQDGIEGLVIPWDSFDVLFIGGTTEWKLSERAFGVMATAKDHGKWVHAGRINSLKRFRLMQIARADSADGTFVAFGPDQNIPRMKKWIDHIAERPTIWDTQVEELA